ncbi:type IV pilus assembly protein PilW [Pseudomonas pohangensis]|uniref:Type IV pilus assembly protein PilW n=1 Tax=Pseudomonas pohangensis TaxID=364197 RepID=A0A1H2E378_9PSED|nr:prepilin-type N-terminal cleavage/methylation domain-containing protein [Pseudomonas pohangensis]SDT89652.1 type IV pilus assembly protein PilW [Pseudomonas pohangensis]
MSSLKKLRFNKQRGLSLIELMVAILISAILLLGVVELFLNTFRTDRTHTELSRVQESGRIAMELISREVRRAGYQGCISSSIRTTAGAIQYPDDAISGPTTTSFTVNYARETGAGSFPNRNCDNQVLHPFQATFSNCGANLCINTTDTGGNQTLTNDTQIASIEYGVLKNNRINWVSSDAMATSDWPNVHKLRIALVVSAPNDDGFLPRRFTSVIELRNRL